MKKLLIILLAIIGTANSSFAQALTKNSETRVIKTKLFDNQRQQNEQGLWPEPEYGCRKLDFNPILIPDDMFMQFLGVMCFPDAPNVHTQIMGWNPDTSRTTIMGRGTGIDIISGNLVNTAPNITQTLSQVGNTVTLSNGGGSFNLPASATARTFNNNVSRALNSNFTISTTRDASVSYSVSLSCTNPLLVGSSSANAFLEYSTDSGSTWITVSDVSNASSVAIAVTIALTQPNKFVLSGMIPANALVRIRTTTSGTASATFGRAQEVLL